MPGRDWLPECSPHHQVLVRQFVAIFQIVVVVLLSVPLFGFLAVHIFFSSETTHSCLNLFS